MTQEAYNKIKKKIARQNQRTQSLMANYVRTTKRVTRITFSRKAQWDHIDTTKVYYSYTRLQA